MKILKRIENAKSKNSLILYLEKTYEHLENEGYIEGFRKDLIDTCRSKKNNCDYWDREVATKLGINLKFIKKLKYIEDNIFNVDVNGSLYIEGRISTNLKYKIPTKISDKILLQKVSIGGSHVLCLSTNKTVYAFGSNSFGQLGLGREWEDTIRLEEIMKNCKEICAGYSTSMVITCNDKLYGWGCTENGRIGLDTSEDSDDSDSFREEKEYFPTLIKHSIKNLEKLTAGSTHMCGLDRDGHICSAGHWRFSGHDSFDHMYTINYISSINHIKFRKVTIGIGGYHTLALTKSGYVYSWGHNRVGQLGIKFSEMKQLTYQTDPIKIKTLENIIDISAGWGHSGAIDVNKNVYVCGRNEEYQLGINKELCVFNERDHKCICQFYKIVSNENFKRIDCASQNTYLYTDDYIYTSGLFNGNVVNKEFTLIPSSYNIKYIYDSIHFTVFISDGMNEKLF